MTVMSLVAARAAFDAGDVGAALAPLVEVWRPSRCIALGELIDALGRAVRADLAPFGRHARWLEAAERRDPRELTALLSTLTECTLPRAIERLQALAKWGPDPRTARALIRELRAPQFVGQAAAPFWHLAGALIAEGADPGSMLALQREARHHPRRDRPDLGRLLGPVVMCAVDEGEAVLRGRRPLSGSEQRVVASLHHALDERFSFRTQRLRPPSRGDLLLDAIIDDPEDDQLRRVYADWLAERSDPRGELIQLQMLEHEQAATEAQRKRASRLLRKHRRDWIRLGRVNDKTVVFERGFMSACKFLLVDRRRLDAANDTRELMTVRRLDVSGQPIADLRHLPVLPYLRSLLGVWDEHVVEICDPAASPLPRLQALTFSAPESYGPRLRARLSEGAGVPHLRHVHVGFDRYGECRRPADFAWLFNSSLGQRLRTFGLTVEADEELSAWRAYLRTKPHGPLRRLVVSERYGVQHVFERTRSGNWRKREKLSMPFFQWWPGEPLD